MLSLFQNRPVLVLAVLVILGALIGALHNRAVETGKPFLIQDVVQTALAPSNITFHTIFALGDQAARLVRPRSALLRENARLRREAMRLRRENSLLREAAAENSKLRRALQLRQTAPLRMISAEIISRRASSWFDTAILDRGRNAGLQKGAAVVSESGMLVGQIVEVNPFTSQVAALTDANSGIGAMLRRSRHSGVLQGQDTDYLVLSYLPKDADVRVKDVVVSSGMGRVIPRGFPIGRVERVVRNKSAGTTSAWVTPSVRLDEVEQVFVINPEQGSVE